MFRDGDFKGIIQTGIQKYCCSKGEEVDPDYRTFFGPQRVIAHRNVCGFVEYMVKWHGLPYAEVRPDHWP